MGGGGGQNSEDFSLLVAFLLVTFSWLFRGPLLSRKQCSGLFRYFFVVFFVAFSWLFLRLLGKIAVQEMSGKHP